MTSAAVKFVKNNLIAGHALGSANPKNACSLFCKIKRYYFGRGGLLFQDRQGIPQIDGIFAMPGFRDILVFKAWAVEKRPAYLRRPPG